MKKLVILITITFFTLSGTYAEKIAGYFINKNGDTIHVLLKIPIKFKFFTYEPNYEKLQWKVKYFDANNQKHILTPNQAKELCFKYYDKNIRMLSRYNNLRLRGSIFSDNTYLFLRLEIDGKLKLFNYYSTQSSPPMYNPSTGAMTGAGSYTIGRYILQKDNEKLFRPRGIYFRKDMSEFLSDCPDLVQKIEIKTYRNWDLEQIVKEYNEKCSEPRNKYKSPRKWFSVQIPKASNWAGVPFSILDTSVNEEGVGNFDVVYFWVKDFGEVFIATVRLIPDEVLTMMAQEDIDTTLSNLAFNALYDWRQFPAEPEVVEDMYLETHLGKGILRTYLARKGSLLAKADGRRPTSNDTFDTIITVLVVKHKNRMVSAIAENDSIPMKKETLKQNVQKFFKGISL